MQNFVGAHLSPNSVRNAVWHALNEPVCQYLRKRNPRCSTVYIDDSLGPLARDSPCINLFSDTSAMRMCVYQRFRFIEFGSGFSLWHLFARRRICISPLLPCEWYSSWRWRLKFKPKRRNNFSPGTVKLRKPKLHTTAVIQSTWG